MNVDTAVELLTAALRFAQQIEAIARRDPEVWERIKDDFNTAKENFNEASKERK